MPNIPYRHWVESEPMKIPILSREYDKESLISLDEISRFVKSVEGFFYAIRVYTVEKYREIVRKATLKTFNEYTPIRTEVMFI